MKVGIAQVNPRVGDLAANSDLILRESAIAAAAGAELVLFPELSLIGYPPLDLLDEPEFILRADDARARLVERLGAELGSVPIVFGTIGHAQAETGKSLVNVAVLVRGGREIAERPKSLLPSYDVFDEDRWFVPGRDSSPIDLGASLGRIGLSICEDIWNDTLYWKHRLYERDPIADLVRGGAGLIVNLSASPYHRGKAAQREDMLRATARRHGSPVIFVNQVGANDDLIFDGASLVLDADGSVRARLPSFEAATVVIDLDGAPSAPLALPDPRGGDVGELQKALVLGIRDYVKKCGFPGVLVGLSGGIDSAVVAVLAAEAVGAANVEAVLMPSRFTAEQSNTDALALARNLGIATRSIPIEPMHAAFLSSLGPHFDGKPADTTEENIQARVRGTILMALSNKHGRLVLATGNKSEFGVGYCTLYGDMVGGLAVLGDCYKAWVRELARHFNETREVMPQAIIDRAPSAELRPDQADEDDLPKYAILDRILGGFIERRRTRAELVSEGLPAESVDRVRRLLDRNEFKRRQAAPILRVTPRAFGPGRRLPLARGPL